jgi:hypothetical protein
VTDKPAIVVYGNCAAEFLANELRRVPAVSEQYDVYWCRSFIVLAKDDEPFDVGVLSRCAVLLEQAGNFRDDLQRWGGGGQQFSDIPVPPNCRRLRFPPLFMNTLWPFATRDPRSEAAMRDWIEEGPYPQWICNSLILDIMKEEKDPDRVYERFCAIRIKDKVDLDRLHELTLAKIRGLDRDSDVTVGDFIEHNFSTLPLFRVQVHPAGPLLRYLCEEVFRALDLSGAISQERLDELQNFRGLGKYDAPIHPEIIEHFGLDWARNLSHCHFAEGYFSYDEFIRRYIRFDWTPLIYIGVHLAAKELLLEAEAVLAEAARRQRAPSSAFHALGNVRQRLGWADAARAAFVAAAYAPRSVHYL